MVLLTKKKEQPAAIAALFVLLVLAADADLLVVVCKRFPFGPGIVILVLWFCPKVVVVVVVVASCGQLWPVVASNCLSSTS